MKSILFILMTSMFFVNTAFAEPINYNTSLEIRRVLYHRAVPSLKKIINATKKDASDHGFDIYTAEGVKTYINNSRARLKYSLVTRLKQLKSARNTNTQFMGSESLFDKTRAEAVALGFDISTEEGENEYIYHKTHEMGHILAEQFGLSFLTMEELEASIDNPNVDKNCDSPGNTLTDYWKCVRTPSQPEPEEGQEE